MNELLINVLWTCMSEVLCFQRFIQVDIHGYNPSPGDLAYPDKLVVAVSYTCT